MKFTALYLALSALLPSQAKKLHKKKHHMHKDFPVTLLPKADEAKHFTSALPDNSKDGTFNLRKFRELFYDKHLTYPEIKNLFT
jgi:hypothetical protein